MKSGHTLEQSVSRGEDPGNMENDPRASWNDEAHRFMLGNDKWEKKKVK